MSNQPVIRYSDFPFLKQPVSIVIVDDHPIVTDGLRGQLETQPDLRVVAICHTGEEALTAVAQANPDLVIIDLDLQGSHLSGIDVIRQLRKQSVNSQLKLLVISAYRDPQRVLSAVSAGIDGYVLKTSTTLGIIQAIRTVMGGIVVWDPDVKRVIELYIGNNLEKLTSMDRLAEAGSAEPLTDREWEVLELIARGYSNSEIANELVISPKTVKVYTTNIYAKIGVNSREQARVWYYIYPHDRDGD